MQLNIIQNSKNNKVSNHSTDASIAETNKKCSLSLATQGVSVSNSTSEKLENTATESDTQSTAKKLINQGNKLWQEGKLDEAISTFEQAIETDANAYKAHHFIGCILAKQSKFEAAAAAYNQALKINPNYHWSYHGLGQVLFWQGKVDQAIAGTNKAIEIEPEEAEFYYLLGKCLERQGNAEKAIAAYQEAIKIKSDFALVRKALDSLIENENEVLESSANTKASGTGEKLVSSATENDTHSATQELINQGNKLWQEGKLDEAISTFEQAIETDANAYKAHHFIGCILAKQSKFEAAAAAYNQALKINPNYHWSYHGLGQVLFWQGKVDQAINFARKAIEIRPEEAPIYYQLGQYLESQGNVKEAVYAYRQAITIEPDFALAREALENTIDTKAAKKEFEKGEIYFNQSNWKQAINCYLRACELDCNNHWYRSSLATAFLRQGNLEQAEQNYHLAIRLKPDSAWDYKCLANYYYHKKNWEKAINFFDKAIKIDPYDLWYCDNLGHALFNLEQWNNAEIAYKKSLKINPNDPDLQIKFGRTLLKQQKWEEAEIASNQAILSLPENTELYTNLITSLKHQGKIKKAAKVSDRKNLYSRLNALRLKVKKEAVNFFSYATLGRTLEKLKQYPEAAAMYHEAILLDSQQTWWLHGSYGECLYKIGKWAESEQAFRKAIEITSENSLWLYSGCLKALYKMLKYDEIIKISYELIDLGLKSPEIYKYFGEALLTKQKWSEAIDHLNNAVEIYDHRNWYCAQFYSFLGYALSQKEQWQEAAAAFYRSLELDTKNFNNYNDLGNALLFSEKWSEAKAAYLKALERNTCLTWSHHLSRLGWYYYFKGNNCAKKQEWNEAKTAYRQAIELNPDYHMLYNKLGEVLEQQQKWVEATEIYRQSTELNLYTIGQGQNTNEMLDHMKELGLVICINSFKENQSQQDAIRNTWLQEVVKRQIPYFFVIGKPSCQSYLDGDILYVDAPDTNEYQTQKTFKLFEFIHNHTYYSHSLIVNDNCYVSIDAVLKSGFENQNYTGKLIISTGELNIPKHIQETSTSSHEKEQEEDKKTWADGATGYFLNRYAMRKLLEYLKPQNIELELYEDKLIGTILRKAGIDPVCPEKYVVFREKDDHNISYKIPFKARIESPYPHQTNNIAVFSSDEAPAIFYEIYRNYYDENYQSPTFLRNFYWFDSQSRNHICLRRVDGKEIKTGLKDILCFIVERNESLRLPYLLSYYRSKGISKFFIVDNNSTDDTLSYLSQQPDVYLWHTSRSYAESKWGVDWIEILLQNYGVNRWCLLVDSDEILYYPDCETKNIPQLCQEMDRDGKNAMSTVLLDLYSKQPIKDTKYRPKQNFLEVCSYFDKNFYSSKALNGGPEKNVTSYFGGLRGRMFGGEQNSFCINKTPLVKYNFGIRLYEGFHWIGNVDLAEQTGCLLHFKYFSTFHEYAKQEALRGEHWNGGSEYIKYARKLEEFPNLSFYDSEISVKLENSQTLIDFGVIKRGNS